MPRASQSSPHTVACVTAATSGYHLVSTGPRRTGATRTRRRRELAASNPDPTSSSGSSRGRDLGIVALCLLAPIWGYGWVVTKVALDYTQPITFAALGTALSAAGLFLVLLVLRRPLRPPPIGFTLLIGLLQTTAFVGLVLLAIRTGGAGKTAVLAYTMPFWLLLLAWAFLGERLHDVQWLAVGLMLAGLVLVVEPWRLEGVLSSVLSLLSGVAWAASALVVKLMGRRHRVDVLSLTAWQMLLGSLPLVLAAGLAYDGAPVWSATFVGALAYNVILANVAAWPLWLYALRSLSAGTAGLGTLAVPVIGVVAAWLQLGERPGPVKGAGIILIIGALAIISVRGVVIARRTGSWDKPGVRQPAD
jgi:drug/metabolite transporter (DMT)-like permease